MKRHAFIASVVTIGMTTLLSNIVCAESMTGKIYGRLGGGGLMLNDVAFAGSSSSGGITYTANGSYSFDLGVAAAGSVGYRYNRWIAFEGELGYGKVSYDTVSGNFTASANGSTATFSGPVNVDGDVTIFSGLFNVIVTPLGFQTFSPYLGGGAGVVHVNDQINSIGGDTSISGEATSDILAADVLAGFDVAVKDSFCLGAHYRYLWIDSGGNGVDDATAHTVLLTGKFDF